MDEQQASSGAAQPRRRARGEARGARGAFGRHVPYITRALPYYEVLGAEGLATIERNAETILEEIGIDFRDDAESLGSGRRPGADVQGRTGALPARPVPVARAEERAARVRAARAQPCAQRLIGGNAHRVRAGLRLALHPQPR